MRNLPRFVSGTSALLGLLAMLMVLALPVPLQAQARSESATAQTQSRYLAEEDRGVDQHTAFLRLAAQYTEAMIAGLLTGGLLMNRLVGGVGATMAGTVAGTVIACWLTLRQAESHYIVREVR